MLTFFHPAQLKHYPRSYYSRGQMRTPQEIPDRARELVAAVKSMRFDVKEPPDAGLAPLSAVHSLEYLDFLRDAHREWKSVPEDWGDEVMSNIFVREPNALKGILAKAGKYLADGSCPIGADTWETSYWSAQSAVAAARAVNSGEKYAYALCRPPGHHARREAAGGFCYLNSTAIAAEELRLTYDKVAILDADMHHGQGVQEIFYDRSDVLYASVHGDPTNFYPVVAGHSDEYGYGNGDGFNCNYPMPHGASESVFFDCLAQAITKINAFKPKALVFALGFDIYKDDPQSKVAVTTPGFRRLGKTIADLNLPTVIVQEGGYHLDTLQENCRAFFSSFS